MPRDYLDLYNFVGQKDPVASTTNPSPTNNYGAPIVPPSGSMAPASATPGAPANAPTPDMNAGVNASPANTLPVTRYTTPAANPSVLTAPTLGAVDENTIREETRKRMQSQIDAINANYANLITQENAAGQDRAGQTRAMSARGGILTSDFGAQQAEKTTKYNAQQQKNIVDSQNLQIQGVMDKIEERAKAEIATRKQDNLNQYNIDYNNYKDNLAATKEAQANAKADMKTLAEKGLDINKLDPAQKSALLKQAGYDPNFGELVYNAMKPKKQQVDYKFEKLNDGQGLFYGTDPETGELKQIKVPIDLPPDWSMQIAPDGTVIGFNKNTGEAAVLSEQGQFAKQDSQIDIDLKRAQIDKIRADIAEGGGNALLSVEEAQKLGVPYGTTKQGAIGLVQQTQEGQKAINLSQTKEKIDQIASLLQDGSGLTGVVGPNPLARFSFTNFLTGVSSKAIGNIQQITEQLTLDKLIEAKANGATFGALSDSERKMLASAASKIGTWAIHDKNDPTKVVGYDVDEKTFKAELDKIANAAKMDYIYKGGDPTEVSAQVMDDGTVWTQTSSGFVKILDKVPQKPQAPSQPYGPASPFQTAGNASASTKVKGYTETIKPLEPIDPDLNKISPSLGKLTGNSKALALSVTEQYPPGSVGPGKGGYEGQCGVFVRAATEAHGMTYPRLGDSLQSKTKAIENYGVPASQVKLGAVIVTRENPTYGHVAWIIGKNEKGWIVAESNFKQSKRVSYGRVIPYGSDKIIGYINPTRK